MGRASERPSPGTFGAKPFILRSWLRHLTYVRNICAHHSRLFNRVMTTRPTMISPDSAYKGDKQFPTLLVIQDGKIVAQSVGLKAKEQIKQMIPV